MTDIASTLQRSDRLRRWLIDDALPLWSTAGVDPACGGFVERLTMAGTPDLAATKRVRVQARQIYVFAHASVIGLCPQGVDIARQGYEFLMRHACPDGPAHGFVHSLDREGRVVHAHRDSYDHAFLVFAFSWYYRATRDDAVRSVIGDLIDAIDVRLTLPDGDGVAVDHRIGPDRLQNPQMHLFEAMLAAAEATGEHRFMERADRLAGLFRNRMFDVRAGVLREFYDADWQPAPGERGQIVEPGHHCEWIWLLKRHADMHRRALPEEVCRLADFVERHGRPGGDLLLCDQLRVDGSVVSPNTRCWPQTEALKAELALAEARGTSPPGRIDAIVDLVFDRFLDRPIAGGWTDWTAPDGTPLVGTIPASTFYHLFLAFSEYLRASEPIWPLSRV